jgi:hypothetical protein
MWRVTAAWEELFTSRLQLSDTIADDRLGVPADHIRRFKAEEL